MEVSVTKAFFSSAQKLRSDSARVIAFMTKFLSESGRSGINLEQIRRGRDHSIYSARVTRDLRAIIYQVDKLQVLIHVDHHDPAYDWVAKRSFERHHITGEMQILVLPETHNQAPTIVPEVQPPEPALEDRPGLFDNYEPDYLLQLGVPKDHLVRLKHIDDEDALIDYLFDMPESLADRLIVLATGEKVAPPQPLGEDLAAAVREGRMPHVYALTNVAGLEKLLASPMNAWLDFLHPDQETLVNKAWRGPVKVTGSAGTGKTVVAMHRARHLALGGKRVLFTTFVKSLCTNVLANLRLLCTGDEAKRITVSSVHGLVTRVLRRGGCDVCAADDTQVLILLTRLHRAETDFPLTLNQLKAEWRYVIQRHGIRDWDGYRDVRRVGRGKRLVKAQRRRVWRLFDQLFDYFKERNILDFASYTAKATELMESDRVKPPFDAVVIDEVQDLGREELLFLKALGGDNLMLVGDAGQRLYQPAISFSALGISVRGRSRVLRVNYRTTAQIRARAECIRGQRTDDMDGGVENTLVRDILSGPHPVVCGFKTDTDQYDALVETLTAYMTEGYEAGDLAVFVRGRQALEEVKRILEERGVRATVLSRTSVPEDRSLVRLGTMHRAKGLEFRVVFLLHIDAQNMPARDRERDCFDEQDRTEFLDRERNLLYVSMTRARDCLHISYTGTPSPFL